MTAAATKPGAKVPGGCPMAIRCISGLPLCPTCRAAEKPPTTRALAVSAVDKAFDIANVIMQLEAQNEALRGRLALRDATVLRLREEVASLRSHIDSLAKGAA